MRSGQVGIATRTPRPDGLYKSCRVMNMPQRRSNILRPYVHGPRVPRLREVREAVDRPVAMLESSQPCGIFEMPAVSDLVLSQSVGRPFRYTCDLGAGRFSGQTQPMDFVAIAPGVAPWCDVPEPACLRFMGVSGALARACLERDAGDPLDFGPIHSRHHGDPLVAQGLDLLWRELGRRDPAARLFVDSMMSALVVRLARLADQSAEVDDRRGGLAPQHSARVIEYMEAHLDNRIRLAELAALCNLSPWHFSRAFRETHGHPPHRYLTRLRIQRARELLERTALSITEIAMATGYSPQQLVRHFRQATGLPPGEYRRLYLEHPPHTPGRAG